MRNWHWILAIVSLSGCLHQIPTAGISPHSQRRAAFASQVQAELYAALIEDESIHPIQLGAHGELGLTLAFGTESRRGTESRCLTVLSDAVAKAVAPARGNRIRRGDISIAVLDAGSGSVDVVEATLGEQPRDVDVSGAWAPPHGIQVHVAEGLDGHIGVRLTVVPLVMDAFDQYHVADDRPWSRSWLPIPPWTVAQLCEDGLLDGVAVPDSRFDTKYRVAARRTSTCATTQSEATGEARREVHMAMNLWGEGAHTRSLDAAHLFCDDGPPNDECVLSTCEWRVFL